MNFEKLFEKAVKEPSFRQKFVNSLDLGRIKRYICGIVAEEKDDFIIEEGKRIDSLMECLHWDARSLIMVYPFAFKNNIHENVYDFISTLKFHEGFHAYENYNNLIDYPKSFLFNEFTTKKILDIKADIRAGKNVLDNITKKNSNRYINFSKQYIVDCENKLENIFKNL